MANEGIFITKNGVTLPVATEMAATNLSAYQADLVLPLIKDTDHVFNVFEFFKYRMYINENVHAKMISNAKTNFTPNFLLGAGTLNTSTGEITPSSVPAQIEENNKVFLVNSSFSGEQLASGDDIAIRIASIDGLSRILLNIDTHTLTFHKANVLTDTQTPSITEPEKVQIEVADDEITFSTIIAPATLYSLPRTFVGAVLSGAVGVFNSSGSATGDALPFDQTDTFEAADITGTGTLSITSSFGQASIYTVKLGAAIVATEGSSVVVIDFVAGQSGTHSATDDYSGGVGTKTYSVASGSLPAGITLTSGGVIQGTPSTDGETNVTIEVMDEFGASIYLEYLINVKQTSNVNYNPPPAVVNVAYSYNPDISGVVAAELTDGVLPTGLSLNEDTGEISGTPTANGSFSFTILITSGDDDTVPESVAVSITVYDTLAAEVFRNGDSAGIVLNSDSVEVQQADSLRVDVTEGSGNYQYSITGGNFINSDGVIEINTPGTVTVTVVDTVTGQMIQFELNVAGQGDTCGFAIETEDTENTTTAPCTEIVTDCHTPINVGFQGLALLKGLEPTDVAYREYPSFDSMESASVQNNGKPFVMFRSSGDNGYAVAKNPRDGKPFIVEFLVDASVANSTHDMVIGVTDSFDNAALTELGFAVAITTVADARKVEIRVNNAYASGSRFPIAEGQQIGFGVFSDSILLYIDGILKYELTSNTFSCMGLDLVFFATKANLIVGGRAGNIIYDISTSGTPDEVGTIDAQTGLYTPAPNNVSLVNIVGYSSVNINAHYSVKIRVIRGAPKASFERAMIEGIPVECWIAEGTRKDDLPMRLDREGNPDRNQFGDLHHLGTLQGSGKLTTTATRNDFRNDKGATSTGLVFDKVTFAGVFLNVRDFATVKRLVPYMRESNSRGVRTLKQYSTGCHHRLRILMIWQNPDCEDVPVFDAIEVGNGLSYTMFDIEVGQGVQSNIPISIEGFPDRDGILFEYNQFDKAFHRIGS